MGNQAAQVSEEEDGVVTHVDRELLGCPALLAGPLGLVFLRCQPLGNTVWQQSWSLSCDSQQHHHPHYGLIFLSLFLW